MNELNVFKNPYHFIHMPGHWLKWFFRGFKWAAQRICRGYSDQDLGNLNSYYASLLEQSLISFANDFNFIPLNWEEDEWIKYIKDCAELCRIMSGKDRPLTEADEEFSRLYNNRPSADSLDFLAWQEKVKEVNNILIKEEEADQKKMQEAREELFRRLNEVWDLLWD